jgi:hypothetical protein
VAQAAWIVRAIQNTAVFAASIASVLCRKSCNMTKLGKPLEATQGSEFRCPVVSDEIIPRQARKSLRSEAISGKLLYRDGNRVEISWKDLQRRGGRIDTAIDRSES